MKKIMLVLALVLACATAWAQYAPPYIAPGNMEPVAMKVIQANIATTSAASITIPIFTAPCQGYIAVVPNMSSTSGSAAADTSATQKFDFYIMRRDSAATAATDTMAWYTTRGPSGVNAMTANKNYRFIWLSAKTSRLLRYKDILTFRSAVTGAVTAVTNLAITVVFVPTKTTSRLQP